MVNGFWNELHNFLSGWRAKHYSETNMLETGEADRDQIMEDFLCHIYINSKILSPT